MKRKIIKTGNSLAVTIPSGFAKEMGVNIGDEAELKIDIQKSEMRVQFFKKPKQISLFSEKKSKK